MGLSPPLAFPHHPAVLPFLHADIYEFVFQVNMRSKDWVTEFTNLSLGCQLI